MKCTINNKQHALKLICTMFLLFLFQLDNAAFANSYSFEVKRQQAKDPNNTNVDVLLIPGLMSNAGVYKELANELNKQYHVHLISVKGFAGTPQDSEFSLEQLVADLAHYIVAKKLNKTIVVGHSLGGLTAFKMATEHEALVSKVVSIDGLPFIGPIFTRDNNTTVEALAPQASAIKAMYNNMNADAIAQQTRQGVFIQATSQEDQARVIEMARSSDPKTVANALFDVMSTDLREAITYSTMPMLMLGASGAFTQDNQHQMVESMYRSQFAQNENVIVVMNTSSRHFMMFDNVDWVYQQMQTFLEK